MLRKLKLKNKGLKIMLVEIFKINNKLGFILIFITIFLSCKDAHRSSDMKTDLLHQSSYISEYDSLIFLAEHFIVKSQKDSSIALYSIAFNKYPNRERAKDLYNALVLNVEKEKYSNATLCFKELTTMGFDSAFINSKKIFKRYLSSKEYKNYLKLEFNNDKKEFQQKIDSEFINTVQALVKADQNFYCSISGYNDSALTDSISEQFYNILIKNYNGRLPNDKEIGIFSKDSKNISQVPFYLPLIVHSFQKGSSIFDSILYNSIYQGKANPEIISLLFNFKNNTLDKYGMCFISSINCNLYQKKYNYDRLKRIVNNRSQFGLYSLSEQKEKILFNNKHKDNPYLLFNPLCHSTPDSSSFQYLIKYYEKLSIKDKSCE